MSVNDRSRIGVWGRVKKEDSIDRDDAIRRDRVATPSQSQSLSRCTTCHQWGAGGVACTWCGVQWTPKPLTGFVPVTDTDAPHRRR